MSAKQLLTCSWSMTQLHSQDAFSKKSQRYCQHLIQPCLSRILCSQDFSDHWSLTEVIRDVHADYDGTIISHFPNGAADVLHHTPSYQVFCSPPGTSYQYHPISDVHYHTWYLISGIMFPIIYQLPATIQNQTYCLSVSRPHDMTPRMLK